MTVPPPPPSSSHAAPLPPGPKKTSPWVWVGVGCLVVILLGLATCFATGMLVKRKISQFAENPAMSLAKIAVQANPDYELVSTDDDKGTLTLREKKTGRVVTVTLDDIKEGRIEVVDDRGERTEIDLSGQGDLVRSTDAEGKESRVAVPGLAGALAGLAGGEDDAKATGEAAKSLPAWIPVFEGASLRQMFSSTDDAGRSGTYVLTAEASIDEVRKFYAQRLRAAGLRVKESSAAIGGALNGAAVNGDADDGRRTVNVGLTDLGGKTQALITFSERN